MPLFKAYAGPRSGDGFGLYIAIQNSDQEKDIVADVKIRDRNGNDIIDLRRADLTYSASNDFLTGGVLLAVITQEQEEQIEEVAGYTRNEGSESYFYLYEDQVLLRDYTNATQITANAGGTTRTSSVDVNDGLYEVVVTDNTDLETTATESIVIQMGGGRGVSVDGPPEYDPDESITYTLTTALATGQSFSSVDLEVDVDGTVSTITLSSTEETTLLAGGSVTKTYTVSGSPDEVKFSFSADTLEDELTMSLANQPPTVTIATTSGSSVASGATVVYTATVSPTSEGPGGRYIWFVDDIRQATNDHPANTFTLTRTGPETDEVKCTFFDSGGLSDESNTISTSWNA